MDTEFHYYVTYLVALRAGFAMSDAYKISYAAQYVDDNYLDINVYSGDSVYQNVITQNYNLLKPKDVLDEIYMVYHFIPGGQCDTRHDHCTHHLNTAADNINTISILREALASSNPYWIGIASHAFVDSWSHQNFTGTHDCFNAMPGVVRAIIPNIGHADMFTDPDLIGHIWHDTRLVNARIDNNQRFVVAAMRLLEEYLLYFEINEHWRKKIIFQTSMEVSRAFGRSTEYIILNSLKYSNLRMKRYNELARFYSEMDIKPYCKKEWMRDALIGSKWRYQDNYRISDWYLFNQAARAHKKFARQVIALYNENA